MSRFGWVLLHINHCRSFDAKSSLYIYIKYIWFSLVGFYDISTIVGHLMPNPLHTYILIIYVSETHFDNVFKWCLAHSFAPFNISKYWYLLLTIWSFINLIRIQSFVNTLLKDQTVLFQTIQFSVIFVCVQFKCKIVLLSPKIGPDQVLPIRIRMVLGAMAIRGNLHSPKLHHYWGLNIRLSSVINRTLIGGVLPLGRDAVGVFFSPSGLGS